MVAFAYFAIGLIYVFINGAIRKVDTDGDWFLALVWFMLWPLCFIALIAGMIEKAYLKSKN
jgi:hypothetical protein